MGARLNLMPNMNFQSRHQDANETARGRPRPELPAGLCLTGSRWQRRIAHRCQRENDAAPRLEPGPPSRPPSRRRSGPCHPGPRRGR